MGKGENLTDRLNEYGMDEENLRGTNFAIHKNVMVWGGTIIQLSNISSISQYNKWERKEENYFEEVERTIGFKEFKEKNRIYKYAFIGAIICLIIGLFRSVFYIPALALAVWVAYAYSNQRKSTIDVPKTKTDRICHYMICIIMNSTKKYDFELKTEEFRNQVMVALYQRIVDPGNNSRDIQIDLKNCNIVTDSVVNGKEILIGNNNQIGYEED